MANSTTHLRTISPSQSQKEVTLNQIVDALSPAATYGRDASACSGLTWGYFGGTVLVGGAPAQIANGTVLLTASATNYLEADPADGSVSANTSGFSAGAVPLYQIIAGASTVTTYSDLRVLGGGGGISADDVTAAIDAHEAEPDPHPQYLTQTEANALYAPTGDGSTNLAAHVAASDPHTQYQKESEKGVANGYAGLDSGGKVPAAQLPASATAGGTVTSVALTTPGLLFDVTGSPVTTAGTLAMTLKTQAKNKFLAGPVSGADATPTMRAIDAADLPAQPFDLTAFYPGLPTASGIVTRVPVARAVTFPAGLTGSVGVSSVPASASAVFDIQKNGSSVGSMTFATGATTASFTAASSITLAAGDIISIIAPASQDGTLANVGIVLAGSR